MNFLSLWVKKCCPGIGKTKIFKTVKNKNYAI